MTQIERLDDWISWALSELSSAQQKSEWWSDEIRNRTRERDHAEEFWNDIFKDVNMGRVTLEEAYEMATADRYIEEKDFEAELTYRGIDVSNEEWLQEI